MAVSFQPRLDRLPAAQRLLWRELVDVPGEFTLYGGTGIAIQLGHRESVDFDFFGSAPFDPDQLFQSIPFLQNATGVLQKSASTLSVLVNRGGPVQVSFFGVPRLGRVREPVVAADIGLPVADLVDLAGTKAAVVQKRAEAKDYLDIDALIQGGRVDLSTALSAGQAIYGETFNPELTLKALSFFGEGDLARLPLEVRKRLVAAVTDVDLDRLPLLSPLKGRTRPESIE